MVFPRAATLLLAISLPATAFAANIQKSGLKLPSSAAANQAAVVKIFNESYSNYLKFAFPHDELSPLSQMYEVKKGMLTTLPRAGFSDPRNGWANSLRKYIMGLNDLFLQAVNFTKTIDFNMSQTPDTVDVFETTIRYVGGLLSAYELSGKQYPILVQKAQEVADKLAFAWDGSVAVPFGSVNFTTNSPVIGTSNIAEAGTLTLEWTRLSTYTGNQTYADLTLGSVQHMANLVCAP
ncbi:hypothetical protein H0H92_005574 [Tricholoma furcatifolium]|nr:hypothetical protein H0H92_005574 [Tricholoma furcatifolium]